MKKIIIAIVIIIITIIIILVLQSSKIPVLTYHDFVEENPSNSMQISKNDFEKEMKYLSDHHYHSLTLEEMECFVLKKDCSIPRKSVLITMDDGWKNELDIALPILKKYNLNAVIFYVGEHLDDDNPNFMHRADLEKIKSDYPNIEIASHGYALHFEDAYKLTKDEIVHDMELMKNEIDSAYYAYPYGRSSKDYQEALKEEKYHLAFTFGPDKEHRKVSKNDSIYEVPRLNMSNGMPLWKFILRLHWFR